MTPQPTTRPQPIFHRRNRNRTTPTLGKSGEVRCGLRSATSRLQVSYAHDGACKIQCGASVRSLRNARERDAPLLLSSSTATALRHQCTILLVALAKTLQISDVSPLDRRIPRTGKTMGTGRQQDRPPSPARSDGWSHGVAVNLGFPPRRRGRESFRVRRAAPAPDTRLPPETSRPFFIFPPKSREAFDV
jgi:hypothetical protein